MGTPGIDVALASQYKPYGAACCVFRPQVIPLPPPDGCHATPSPVDYRARPGLLEWVHKNVTVASATFQDENTIRLRGTIPFSMDTDQSKLGSYFHRIPSPKAGSTPVVQWASMGLMPLRIIALRGKLTTINDATEQSGRITIEPEEGAWEMAISERGFKDGNLASEEMALWIERLRKIEFDDCISATDKQFDNYMRGMCPWKSRNELDAHASYVMWTSTVRGEGFLGKESVLMSKLWMNKVWSWDNCFNALALAAHPGLLQSALDNFMAPFQYQLSDGRIPDALMYNEITWDFVKPPIQGWTLERLLNLRPEIPNSFLESLYKPLSRFTRMLGQLDFVYGNNVIVNADLASHLILQTNMLAYLSHRLGKGEEEQWKEERDRLSRVVVEELWDGERFLVKSVATGETRRSTSLLQLVPLAASRFLPRQVVEAMMSQVKDFTTEWGLASEPPSSKLYESDGYWRGPIWAPSTIILETGIREAGNVALADKIRTQFFKLCGHGGFAEIFDAVTGEGHRDLSHTWTSSIYLVFREQFSRNASSIGSQFDV